MATSKRSLGQKIKNDTGLGIVALFVILAYMFLQLSCWGIIPGAMARNVAFAPAFWHIVGFVLFVASGLWVFLILSESKYVTKSEGLNAFIAVALMALSVLSYSGFYSDFRAGY